ncbi:MAG: hypothetical protein R3D00_29435 [Bacteroidia bacterium]
MASPTLPPGNPMIEKLYKLQDQFGEDLFFAIYSLPELTGYITNNPKQAEMRWDLIDNSISSLSESAKNEILENIAHEMIQMETTQVNLLLAKMKAWCIGKSQFRLFAAFDFFFTEKLIESLYLQNPFKKLIEKEILLQGQSIEGLSSYQMNEVYYKSLNLLATMREEQQAEVFANLYLALSK